MSVCRSVRCRRCPTDERLNASVSFSFSVFTESEERDLRVTINETPGDRAMQLLGDVFNELPPHVQEQIVMSMVLWMAESMARIERKLGGSGAGLDDFESAIEDFAIEVKKGPQRGP